MTDRFRRPFAADYPARSLHPGAWWLWALGLGTAASRSTNPLLLGLVLAVAGFVVAARRSTQPWADAYGVFLRLGLIVIAIRTVLHIVFGGGFGSTVLVTLPQAPLPGWASGVRIGGPVTAEGLVAAVTDGLRLAVLLACVGAANALANPKRLLRSLPAALYEVSVAVVVTLSTAPQLITSARQVRRARQLRGDRARGPRVLRTVLVPVLQDALDRSIALAAAMDSRGYGRTAGVPPAVRRATAAMLLAGLLGMCIGVYGLLDAGSPVLIGLPMLLLGAAMAAGGLLLAARRVPRTRYRPDRWRAREAAVALSGLAAVVAVLAAEALGDTDLVPPVAPLTWPSLPLLPAVGVLAAVLPAWVAPSPDSPPEAAA
ncbi:MAG TPA: energy-coupling factor transporter transmembrane component T [Pseudonocardiaceae bacterium]